MLGGGLGFVDFVKKCGVLWGLGLFCVRTCIVSRLVRKTAS